MDKTTLSTAILNVLDEGKELGEPWLFHESQFPFTSQKAEDMAHHERQVFVQRVTRRYFDVLRIELAKDGN
jgi:hypothetical protein